MSSIALRAHFDGEKIVLDEPYELNPATNLIVMVVPNDLLDEERQDWIRLSLASLERAYGDDEPEYTFDMIKEWNPLYKGE